MHNAKKLDIFSIIPQFLGFYLLNHSYFCGSSKRSRYLRIYFIMKGLLTLKWYAIFVESGKEEVVQKYLKLYFNEQSLKSVVPKRLVPEKKSGIVNSVMKNIFPGYVLIKTEMTNEMFHKIKKIPRSLRLVNNGSYYSQDEGTYYSSIDEREITPILQLMGNGEVVDYSKVYLENSKVIVESGPLKGLEGLIKKVDKHKNRAKIFLTFMGVEKTIDVGIEILSKPL